MIIRTPEAFRKLAACFGQDISYDKMSAEEMIRGSLSAVNSEEASTAIGFIDSILGGRYSGQDLQEMWRSTPASIYFSFEEDLMRFLELLRTSLQAFWLDKNYQGVSKLPEQAD